MSKQLVSGSKHLKGKERKLMVMLVEGDETWNGNLPEGLSLLGMYPVDSNQLQLVNKVIGAVHQHIPLNRNECILEVKSETT